MRSPFRLPIAVVLAVVLAAPWARAADKIAVTMTVPAFSLSFALGYLAEDLGFFAKEGLAVKQLDVQGLAAINAVISGSADFAEPSAASLTRAAAHGQKLLAIARLTDKPFVQLVLRKDIAEAGGFDPKAPLATRAQLLKGRTIGVDSVNSVVHAYLRLVARAGGFDPENVKTAFLSAPSMVAAFDTKQVDGFAMTPPWPEQPVLAGTAVMLASGPDGDPPFVPFANTVLLTRPEMCATRKPVCEKMGRAFAAAAAAVRNDPDAALAALSKRFSTLDPKLMAVAFEVLRKITPSPPTFDPGTLENVDRYNIEAGLMKPEEKLPSYDALYSNDYVR
jgi:ABC-type nitrate/sulfonate/bicarbonate transport system substrate-binding protein